MRVSDCWFDFGQTGKPTSGGSPESPSGNGSRDSTMQFGEANFDQNELYESAPERFHRAIKIMGTISNRK